MMKPLCCGIDGILLDWAGGFLQYINECYPGANLRHQDMTACDVVSVLAEKLKAPKEKISQDFEAFQEDSERLLELEPIAPVVRAVRHVIAHHGHVLIATARPEGSTAFHTAVDRICRLGFDVPIRYHPEKQHMVQAGFVVLDDKPAIPDMLDPDPSHLCMGRLVLVRQPWNQNPSRSDPRIAPYVRRVWPCDAEDIGSFLLDTMSPPTDRYTPRVGV